MNRRSRLPLILLFCCLGSVARADSSIGTATQVQPSASGLGAGHAGPLSTGDALSAEELIKTEPSGLAHLRFVDNTDLSVGPSSQVKLDKFVFNTETTAREFVLSTAKGAFRFTTGVSDHQAYRIETPVALIGVRGTRFTFAINDGQFDLAVEQGIVIVCRPDGSHCVEARPNQRVKADSATPPHLVGGTKAPPTAPPRKRRHAFLNPPEPTQPDEPIYPGNYPHWREGGYIGPRFGGPWYDGPRYGERMQGGRDGGSRYEGPKGGPRNWDRGHGPYGDHPDGRRFGRNGGGRESDRPYGNRGGSGGPRGRAPYPFFPFGH